MRTKALANRRLDKIQLRTVRYQLHEKSLRGFHGACWRASAALEQQVLQTREPRPVDAKRKQFQISPELVLVDKELAIIGRACTQIDPVQDLANNLHGKQELVLKVRLQQADSCPEDIDQLAKVVVGTGWSGSVWLVGKTCAGPWLSVSVLEDVPLVLE